MADIVIRGMAMPKDGRKHTALLQFLEDGKCRGIVEYSKSYDDRSVKVFEVVPLPEGHGRLGDLDALMEIIRAHDYPLTAHFNSTDNGMFTQGIQQAVDEVPTIVPADVTDNYVGSKSEEGETDGSKL